MPTPARGLKGRNLHRRGHKPARYWRPDRRPQDLFPDHIGGAKDPVSGPALPQQLRWKRFANEVRMSLGASDYNSFVIRNACDPLRIKSLALEESLEPCRVKRHYQDIADLLSRQ